MDTYRILLLIVGIFILIGVVWDIWRRKSQAHVARSNSKSAQNNTSFADFYDIDKPSTMMSTMQGETRTFANQRQYTGGSIAGNQGNSSYGMAAPTSSTANTDKSTANAPRTGYMQNSSYVNIPMANRQLETIMPSDPRIVKVQSQRFDSAFTHTQGSSQNQQSERFSTAGRNIPESAYADGYHESGYPAQQNMQAEYAGQYSPEIANGYTVRQEPSQAQYQYGNAGFSANTNITPANVGVNLNQQMLGGNNLSQANGNANSLNSLGGISPGIANQVQQGEDGGLIISLSVISRMQRGFPGHKLLKAFESAGLVYGKMHIFHRYPSDNAELPLFSISSAVEPGIFKMDDMTHGFIPGVTLFMSASGKIDSNLAFDLLVRTAKQLGFSLNGELRDHNHKPLTIQTIEKYRSMVMSYAAEYA